MFQGTWWISGKEEEKFSGILSFEGSTIQLNLSDSSTSLFDESPNIEEIRGIILGGRRIASFGLDLGGKQVILQGCSRHGRSSKFGGKYFYKPTPVITYSATTAYSFENSQNVKNTELKFHEIWVGFSHLLDFVNSFIERKYHYGDNYRPVGIDLSYKERALPTAKLDGAKIEFWQGFRENENFEHNHAIAPVVYFKICSEQALSLLAWQANFIDPLRHFLSLATTCTNRVTSIKAFHRDNNYFTKFSDGKEVLTNTPFEIVNKEILEYGNRDFPKEFSPLFRLQDVQDNFEEVMRKWFHLYKTHSIVQYLSFGRLSPVYAEDRFLNLAKALEVYHRAKYPGGSMEKGEFKKKRDEIVGQVEEQHRKWLEEKLNFANQLTLNERLLRLLSDLEELTLHETLGITKEDLSGKIRRTRNELTHYNEKKPIPLGEEAKTISPEEVFYLSHLIEYMLQALLLQEIGLPAKWVEKDRNYSFHMGKLAQALSSPPRV